MSSRITLSREVQAIQIPSGDTITLPAGAEVFITQSLGGTYTVATDSGLARIPAKDADSLGITPPETRGEGVAEGDLEGQVWNQLRGVYDPEIPVNIVDLGLVYDCEVKEIDGKTTAEVKMTLTAPGCGMGPTIAADAQARILSLPGIDEARVELVWDPPWNQDMISEEGRMTLGMI